MDKTTDIFHNILFCVKQRKENHTACAIVIVIPYELGREMRCQTEVYVFLLLQMFKLEQDGSQGKATRQVCIYLKSYL